MADAPENVKIDIEGLNGSEADAGRALEGLFSTSGEDDDLPEGDYQIQQEGEDRPAETGEDENPPTGEHEEGQSEQREGAAIEPPVSWNAEAKEQFKQLPPELQQFVAKRESERETLLVTHGQKASEEAKALAAERTQLANERAQQVTLLQSVLYQLTPEFQQFQSLDWDKLAREAPAEWAQKRQAFDGLQMRWNAAQQQIAGIQQAEQTEQTKQRQTFVQAEFQKLVDKVPDFADRAKFKSFGEDLQKYLPEISQQEWGSVVDHRYLLLAREAMLYRKGVADRAAAQGKRAPATASQQRVIKPAGRQGTSVREEANGKQIAALHGNLRKSGDVRDAAAILTASGMFGKH